MRRVPVLPTILVLLAALLMVRLGVWQIARSHEKSAAAARYAANAAKPSLPFVALWPVKEADLFRRTSATCVGVTGWRTQAGRTATGVTGWRHIAACRTGAEGPGLLVDMGISASAAAPAWAGGPVAGRLTWAETGQPLVARMVGAAIAPTPLIVSAIAAPGLQPTAPPDPAAIPNTSLSYAIQWFVFAGLAVTIYAILLWRRRRQDPS